MSIDAIINEVARSNRYIIDRANVLAAGGNDHLIARRVRMGWWEQIHSGVYQVGIRPMQWTDRLCAAIDAAGECAAVSHRAALILWGLEGIGSAPVEITVPVGSGPVPAGTIVHRTRRPIDDVSVVDGIRVTSVARTLLDACGCLPERVVLAAIDSAVRGRLVTPGGLVEMIRRKAGRGVKGTRMFRRLVSEYLDRQPTGSFAELSVLEGIDRAGVPRPVLQWEVVVADGSRYYLDFGWPDPMKAVEIDGWETHSSSTAHDRDLVRQNALLAMGIEIRRYSGRAVQRDLPKVVGEIAAFIAS